MARMPDGKTVQHSWWANGHQTVRQVTYLSWNAPTELGLGCLPPRGWSPGPQSSLCRWACQCTYFTQNGVSEEPHCYYGGTHWLVRLFILSWQGHQWPSTGCFPPAGFSWSLHKPGLKAWRLVFWHWQLCCHFSGWNSRFIPLISESRLIYAAGCHWGATLGGPMCCELWLLWLWFGCNCGGSARVGSASLGAQLLLPN